MATAYHRSCTNGEVKPYATFKTLFVTIQSTLVSLNSDDAERRAESISTAPIYLPLQSQNRDILVIYCSTAPRYLHVLFIFAPNVRSHTKHLHLQRVVSMLKRRKLEIFSANHRAEYAVLGDHEPYQGETLHRGRRDPALPLILECIQLLCSQNSAAFWKVLTIHFNVAQVPGAEVRAQRSFECKSSIIQHDVAKFAGAMAVVWDLNQSGASSLIMLCNTTRRRTRLKASTSTSPSSFALLKDFVLRPQMANSSPDQPLAHNHQRNERQQREQ
ncbi:hypothetical protein GQ600_11993 [Phytophthora cactorum]|nr:hypothetical protein GQ600_11993 [Phytophthora cactorum]